MKKSQSNGSQTASRPLSVLLVDDHLPLLSELSALLERHAGFRVHVAATIGEALEKLDRTAIDVVVADLKMGEPPGPDGGSLLDEVARIHPSCGKILATADPLGAILAQECGYLWHDKGNSVASLIELIREAAKRT